MIDFLSIFSNVLMFVALLVPGWIMGKRGLISDEAFRGITAVVSEIAMPFLVFVKLAQTDFTTIQTADIVCGLIFPSVLILGMYLLSGVLYRKENVTGRACAVFTNCGFISLPIAAIMFPDSPVVVGMVSLFNLAHTFINLTLGITLYTGDPRHISVSGILKKPVTTAIVLGFLCSFLRVWETAPVVVEYADHLAMLGTPLSMLLLGVQLSKFNLSKVFDVRVISFPLFVKLILAPMLSILLCFVVSRVVAISAELSVAMFLCTAAPSASITVAFARTYGRDAEHAAILTLSSTILCVASIPLMSLVFGAFFG